jgi:TonB family protein
MPLLMTAILQVSIVLAVALGATALLRRRSAALRHWILAVAITCALAAPALELLIPAWKLPAGTSRWATSVVSPGTLAVFESIASDVSGGAASANVARGWRPDLHGVSRLMLGAWAVGAIAMLLMLLTRLMQLRQLARDAHRVDDPEWRARLEAAARTHGVGRPIELLQGCNAAMVVTWGSVRPRVLIPRDADQWSDARIRVVLSHELAHIRRNDWLVQVGAAALRSLYWFHPLAWIAARALNRDAERACDDLVLKEGVSGSEYASHLLAVARDAARQRRQWSAAAAIARSSTLEGRIRAMLNARVNRSPLTRATRVVAVATISLIALAAAALSTNAAAQQGIGSITAVVYDQAGGVLPAVAVKVLHVDSGRTSAAETDRTGTVALRDIPSGIYELTMGLIGFATVKATLDVRPGDRLQRNVVLPLGSLEESVTVVGSRVPSGAVREAAAPAPRAVRDIPPPRAPASWAGGIGGNIKQPTRAVDVKPRYPAELEGTGAGATVTLSGRIGMDGYMLDLKDISATPAHQAFVASAVEAVRQWEFHPTLLNGAPVETNITITVRYRSE